MGTPAERRALVFLAILIALGGGVRLLKAASEPDPGVDAQLALRRQIISVDSARAARQAGGGGSKRTSRTSSAATQGRSSAGRISAPAGGRAGAGGSKARKAAFEEPPLVDVDMASAEDLTRLPGIGPAIAARIVADRAVNGHYGSLRELQRVKGVGPATVARLAPHVTFSGNPRPPSAVRGGLPGASGGSHP